ncbi:hypothetical protein [Clostridium gasigenes]|uniref:Uncharacterized protein n=1 Tax=Clostridium gasigenes TaxID=94869 RepID=A0A7X0SEY3_9CLOT|nr:hypothetical protein [Clostridium gasigenes]MBB6716361.1 hypothetical protein [Clostridium gasigenes]
MDDEKIKSKSNIRFEFEFELRLDATEAKKDINEIEQQLDRILEKRKQLAEYQGESLYERAKKLCN